MTVNRWLKFVFNLRTKTLSLFHELVKEIKKSLNRKQGDI